MKEVKERKKYLKPGIKEKRFSMVCMLESSLVDVGGETDSFDSKENGIFSDEYSYEDE